MKYIIFEDFAGKKTPILFPERILHEEIREQIPYTRVLSAGQVIWSDRGIECHGRAKALQVEAGPEDNQIIAGHFASHEQSDT